MNIKKIWGTAAILMAAVCIQAQNRNIGINLSLWKNICTQPSDSMQTTYANIGFLSAMNRLNGIGINALGSVVQRDVNGLQLTGLANLTGGSMHGIQIAGISNVNGDDTWGLSAAGLVGILGEETKGVAFSGLVTIGGNNSYGLIAGGLINIMGDNVSGVQVSGVANITGKKSNGIIASGLLNVVGGSMNGIQLSGLANIVADKANGLQIGLGNYATHVRGLQIGLVNFYGKSLNGFQLGLVNTNPDTRTQMMLYSGNDALAHLGVRFKNQRYYTILGVSTMHRNLNDKFSIGASYRAGIFLPLYKALSVSGDLGYQHIETCGNKNEWIPRRLYALQARINMEYQFTKNFGIFATGGYGLTRYYNKSTNYDKGTIIEAGIIVF